MKATLTSKQIIDAADRIVARQGYEERFLISTLATEIASELGHAPHKGQLRVMLRKLTDEIGEFKIGRGEARFQRYSPALRTAWKEADDLAKLVGGECYHRIDEENPAEFHFSLVQIRLLVAMLGAKP